MIFLVFMVGGDDLNGAARYVSILQAASALQIHQGIEYAFCDKFLAR